MLGGCVACVVGCASDDESNRVNTTRVTDGDASVGVIADEQQPRENSDTQDASVAKPTSEAQDDSATNSTSGQDSAEAEVSDESAAQGLADQELVDQGLADQELADADPSTSPITETSLGADAGTGHENATNDVPTRDGGASGPSSGSSTQPAPLEAGVPNPPQQSCSSLSTQPDGSVLLLAHTDHNFNLDVEWDVSHLVVAPNSDLFFDWSMLDRDFLGHSVDPLADIDAVSLIVWELTLDELVQKLMAEELSARYAAAAIAVYTENQMTTASFDDFQVAGGGELPREELMYRFDPELFPPDQYTYTVMAQTGGVLGQGVKAVQVFHLDANSSNTSVHIDESSAQVTARADLTSLLPTSVPTAVPNIEIDWSQMETTAKGGSWRVRSIDQVSVVRVPLSPEELEPRFVELEQLADYRADGDVVTGESFNLADLVDTDGLPFQGISNAGTWYLVLRCSRCSPAPWYVTQLLPCNSD